MRTPVTPTQRHPEAVHLIQLTDTHIYAEAGQCFNGVDTELGLARVLAAVRAEQPDAVLVTGDLVHEPVPAAYARLAAMLHTANCPVFCLPGNHDEPALVRAHLHGENLSTAPAVLFNHWVVILLDTCLPGNHGGFLADQELEFLDRTLKQHADRYALVCLHHPPLPVGSPWMDSMGLRTPEALFAVTDRHPGMRGMIWGHIHQEFAAERQGVKLLAAPSTCVQFAPRTVSYTRDNKPPAWRTLRLHARGALETAVKYLAE